MAKCRVWRIKIHIQTVETAAAIVIQRWNIARLIRAEAEAEAAAAANFNKDDVSLACVSTFSASTIVSHKKPTNLVEQRDFGTILKDKQAREVEMAKIEGEPHPHPHPHPLKSTTNQLARLDAAQRRRNQP